MAQVVEALRGDALRVAMDIGNTELVHERGKTKLIEDMKKSIFPLVEQEAKELYREGHKLGGILSRQDGESMSAYCQRRRRWYALFQDLDPTVQLTDEMRGDMILDNATLSKT